MSDLVVIVDRSPSRKVTALACFGAWSAVMLATALADFTFDISDTLEEVIHMLSVGLALVVWVELRRIPSALRSAQSDGEEG